MSVADNARDIRQRIARSARAVGRDPEEITLVAVCKHQPLERIMEAYDAGIEDLGENTAQGLRTTALGLREAARQPRWHFIGRLQRNKVNHVLREGVSMIHSIDSRDLAQAVGQRAPEGGIDVLVQVNIGDEAQKGGVNPGDAVPFAQWVATVPGLRLRGLMGVPPADQLPRPHFERLIGLFSQLRRACSEPRVDVLSMGMSADFETAIECGSTLVRVGAALFGERAPISG